MSQNTHSRSIRDILVPLITTVLLGMATNWLSALWIESGLLERSRQTWLILSVVLFALILEIGASVTEVRRWLLIPLGISVVMVVMSLAQRPCSHRQVAHDFEGNNLGGWKVRREGENQLGIEVRADDGHHCGSGEGSLAFQFELQRTPPLNKAQVAYEAPAISLNQELTGWVYVPRGGPDDLQVGCFVLEDNRDGRMPDKPEWPWYQTSYTPLLPGQWTWVRCFASDFVPNYTGGRWDQPILVGFEFTRRSGAFYSGTVYLDKVILR